MIIIVKYERKTIFGDREYIEDKKNNASFCDLKKSFSFLKKSYDIAIEIDSIVIYWDKLSDFENNIVTIRNYDGINCTEKTQSFETCKKEFYKQFKE